MVGVQYGSCDGSSADRRRRVRDAGSRAATGVTDERTVDTRHYFPAPNASSEIIKIRKSRTQKHENKVNELLSRKHFKSTRI